MRRIILHIVFFMFCAAAFSQTRMGQSQSQNQLGNSRLQTNNSKEQSNNSESLQDKAASNALRPSAQIAMSSSGYPVTAGDIYTLAFAAGSNILEYVITVDTTYKIRVANLAVLDAAGLTFVQLKKQVEGIVTKNYPMSGVQFFLTTPAVFNVTVQGEVLQTKVCQAWALTRVGDLLEELYTPYSSERFVEITSASGAKKEYDLFKALRFGEMENNPYVRPGDVITVKKVERRVELAGEIEREGLYELSEGENIKELVEYYGGGLTPYADPMRIEITRYFPKLRESKKLYLNETNLEENFPLEDSDTVYIYSYSDLNPVVFIEGAISNASVLDDATEAADMNRVSIQFELGTSYSFLIRQQKNIFGAISDLENSYIMRGNEIIKVDIAKILYEGDYSFDEIVQPYDILRVPFKQFFVTVAGAVNIPGRYPYIPDRGWDYYIGLAGGFADTKNVGDRITIVDSNGKKLKKGDPIAPETTITAKANSFTYYFGIYAPIITTVLTAVSTTISVLVAADVIK